MSQIKWLSFSWAYCLILILLSQIHWISAQQQATIINCGNGGVVFDPSNFTVTLDTSANTIRFVGIGHTSVNITNGTGRDVFIHLNIYFLKDFFFFFDIKNNIIIYHAKTN